VNLFLSKCPNVTDLSALRKVQKLQLLNTSGDFQSLQEYGQLTEFSIGRSAGSSSFRINPDMTVFGKQLDKLELNYVRLKGSLGSALQLAWDDLTSIRELTFRGCTFPFTTLPVSSLNQLRSLTLFRCETITYLSELPSSLGTLVIEDCNFVELHLRSSSSTSEEFPLYLVEILGCYSLTSLEISRKISRFCVHNCRNCRIWKLRIKLGFCKQKDAQRSRLQRKMTRNWFSVI
jgi:hypothetical protein